jgi:hypothetical protein
MKKINVLAVAALSGLLLAGCGGSKQQAQPAEQPATQPAGGTEGTPPAGTETPPAEGGTEGGTASTNPSR